MKKLIIIVSCFLFVTTCFGGCGVDTANTNNKRYEIRTIDNEQYLVIDESVIESIESKIDVEMIQEAEIQFDSIDEFVNTVKNGKLNDRQLAVANKTFKKDANGIKVCDFTNIKIPVNPLELACKTVFWSGELYSFYLESANDTIAYYHLLDKNNYDYQYENNYLRFFDNEGITTTKVIENKNNTEYYYSTTKGDMKKVRYTITNAETNLVIDETYRLRMEDSTIPVSQDVPYRITIYGVKSGVYFSIEVFDIVNKPTTEWITQFSVKTYK